MPEAAPLLGALPAEDYFGRAAEERRLRALTRALAREGGRSTALAGRPGTGKSELLRQWYGNLFREGKILPFYYAAPKPGSGQRAWAAEYVEAFMLQALAFRRRDPSILVHALPAASLGAAVRAAWAEAGATLTELQARIEELAGERAAATAASIVPHRFAAAAGMPVLCLLDDLEHLADPASGELAWWSPEALASRVAPTVLSCADAAVAGRLFGAAATVAVGSWPLGPLSDDAAGQFVRHLLRAAGIDAARESRELVVHLGAGSPFYLQALVRALAELPATGLTEVVRSYASSVCGGELGRYWGGLMAGALPDRSARSSAIEILAYCLRDGAVDPEAGRLAARMFKNEAEIEAALAGLVRAGVVRIACSRIAVDADPVFRDYVGALYRREFGGGAPSAVEAALAADLVRTGPRLERRRARAALRAALRTVLEAWDGQQVPAVVFDAAAFDGRFAEVHGADLLRALGGEQDVVTLPRVVSVAQGRIGQGTSPAELEVEALAFAWRGGDPGDPAAEVAWVVRFLPGGAGSDGQLEEFDRAVAALQASGDLPAARLVRWAILGAPFDVAGAVAASRLRVSSSSLRQLEALAALLGVVVRIPSAAAVPVAPASFELEMTIPSAVDAELVAARALEQLAENLNLGPQEIVRLKTALVEACINAFEHSGCRHGLVHLSFAVLGGDLRVRVENRGRALAGLPPGGGGAAPDRRGWGLTLIRELMDEVALEPREDGVSLVMVKHLVGKEGKRG